MKFYPLSFIFYALAFLCVLCASAFNSRAEETKRPNILFAIADDASYEHFSATGCKFTNTPAFDRIAREGALFTHAYTALPKCSPSRAQILTGKNPWQLEEACDHFGVFSAKFKVFPDILESHGYFVGFTGKGWGPGDWKSGGFTRNPAGPAFNEHHHKPPTTGISNVDYAENFKAFLQARPKDKPFCFWYGGHEPHRPYELGSGAKIGKNISDVVVPDYLPDSPVVRNDLLDYGREIEWFDHHLGLMLQMLEDAGELDNTLVIVTSDNGMPFPRVKGHVYEDSCHMPFAVRWPGAIKGGQTFDEFVGFIDIAPTILTAAGIEPNGMTGHSFVNVPRGTFAGSDHVLLGREREDVGRPRDEGYPVRSIRTKDFLYSHNFKPDRWPAGNPETGFTDIDDSPTKKLVLSRHDKYYDLAVAKRGAEELYDLREDPKCVNNVASDPKYADVKAKLWHQMQQELTEQEDPRLVGDGDVFDRYKSVAPRNRAWETAK